MSCKNCAQEISILDTLPEKAKELEKYLDSLGLNKDIDNNQSYLIKSLHKAQNIFGYLPLEVQSFVADKLRLNISDVYGVISFYSFFTTVPPGKYKISVCTGTACFVKGATKVLQEFEEKLGIKNEETSEDGIFSLASLRCVGACSLAPVVLVNDKVYGKVTPKMVQKIINEYKQ